MRTIVDLPDELWKKVKIRAIEEKTSLADIVRRALEEYLKKTRKKEVSKHGKI